MPADGIRFRNLGEFTSVLREYSKVSSRKDPKKILDTKAFYIQRGAVRETLSPSKERIKNELVNLRMSRVAPDAPLAAIIINSRRGKAGLPGLYGGGTRQNKMVRLKSGLDVLKMGKGGGMLQAVKALVDARTRSRRFIASGWLDGIKRLESLAEKPSNAPPKDSSVKRYGRAKGGATPAGANSSNIRTLFWNMANANRDDKGALDKYGLPGFLRAWQAEIDSMKQYIADKMTMTAKTFGLMK